MNFKSLENVLQLFNSNLLLSTIENLVFDFVTWYSPKHQRDEGKCYLIIEKFNLMIDIISTIHWPQSG